MMPSVAAKRRVSALKRSALLFVVLAVSVLPGCGGEPAADGFDYQIGGAYDPPTGTGIVSRDRTAKPADGVFNVCYVNAFQAQPEEVGWWRRTHPELLLSRDGRLVVDDAWNEPLLDISSAEKRAALLRVVGPWIDGCARSGFQAVEPDNLDSYTRSDGLISADDAVAFARLLVDRAHRQGLEIGQKNAVELIGRVRFDLAVVEECERYDECGVYSRAYERVLEVEYSRKWFDHACRARRAHVSLVLRDRDVLPAGAPGHVFDRCN